MLYCIMASILSSRSVDTIVRAYACLVGQIAEKMFTFGKKSIFFHKIVQYDANVLTTCSLFWLSLTISLGDSISSQSHKNLTISNFDQLLIANSHPGEKQLCQI